MRLRCEQAAFAALQALLAAQKHGDFHGLWPDTLLADVFRLSHSPGQETAVSNLVHAQWPRAEAEAFVATCTAGTIYTALCAWGLRSEQVAGTDTVVVVRSAALLVAGTAGRNRRYAQGACG